MGRVIVPAQVSGPVLVCDEGLSFWGGVNADTGDIQDALHPQFGANLTGRIVMMSTSRGSCSGSGVLLNLALNGTAPAAFIFREDEEVLTLGAVVAERMFGKQIGVLRLSAAEYDLVAAAPQATIHEDHIDAGGKRIELNTGARDLAVSDEDQAMLTGADGPAVKLAMEVITDMAHAQGATRLIDVSRGHIDGCIYAGPAFLIFAQRMLDLGAKVRIPTTLNAISVDFANWQTQGVDPAFGEPARDLAAAYVKMGAQPSFTCAPYHLEDRPSVGEDVAWSESNAVIYANSVLGARTVKHPDFLDLCMALTGRAAQSGVYLDDGRVARRVVKTKLPQRAVDAYWPLLGWVLGKVAPDRIPLLQGLEQSNPSEDDLRALCAAFGTTSAAPMLHVAGVTPEGNMAARDDADVVEIGPEDFADAWNQLNGPVDKIDLVALGSPHFSASECRAFLAALNGRTCQSDVHVIITLGQGTLHDIRVDGTEAALLALGVTLVPDLCWCSISEPVFPPKAQVLITNSGKYAHYGPALSGRAIRFGSLADCAEAAVSGVAPTGRPDWIGL